MRRASALLLACAAALAATTVLRLPSAWQSGNSLNHVSGAWLTLADDLFHGTFYRPVHDPVLGYGGTRFFPLEFVLHAGLRALGMDLLAAGYLLSIAAGVLAVAGAFLLVRRTGLPRPAALAFGFVWLAAFATQHALSSARGDLLPAALGALGLSVIARGPSRRAIAGAAALFTLGFAAKAIALAAPAAAIAWLVLRRERREALALALAFLGGAVAVVLVTEASSAGRFLEIVGATATGGAGLRDVVRAPVRLVRQFTIGDPAALALVGAGAGATLASLPGRIRAVRIGRVDARVLAALWLVLAGVTTLVVYASPGTGVNHLVEVEIASAVALGAAWPARDTAGVVARALAPTAAVLGVVVAVGMARQDGRVSRLAELRQVAAEVPAGAPLLSEDPLLPLVLGQRPYVLDGWMLRLASERDPQVAAPLREAVTHGEFGAIVLFRKLGTPAADAWYHRGNLGKDIVGDVRTHYRLASTHGRYRIYVPEPPAGPAETPVAATRRSRPLPAAAGRAPRATAVAP